MGALKIQSKNSLNMKMVVNYLNFAFHIEVKTKYIHKFLKFRFSSYQKHEMALWVHGFSFIIKVTFQIINGAENENEN